MRSSAILDLVIGGRDLDRGVDEIRRPDDLLDDLLGVLPLVVAGGRRDVQRPVGLVLELLERQRAVVVGRRQPKAVLDERVLSGFVALVLALYLWDRLVGLVDHRQEVVGEVIEQRVGRRPGGPIGHVDRVVLDPRAVARLLEHLDVEGRPLLDALGRDEVALPFEVAHAPLHQLLDLLDRVPEFLLGDRVVLGGVDKGRGLRGDDLAVQHVDFHQPVDLVAPKLHADGVAAVHREDLDGVAPDTEGPLVEIDVVSLVVQIDERGEKPLTTDLVAGFEPHRHPLVVAGVAEAVDRRHRGDDDDVLPREKRAGRRVSQAVDLLVYRHVLVDVGVGLFDVGLRLVVVVVGDEVLDGVVRKEVPELLVELGGQRLVVGDDERRLLELLHRPRDGVRLPGAGDAQEGLFLRAGLVARDEFLDRVGLVARGIERCLDPKRAVEIRPVRLQRSGVAHWRVVGTRILEPCVRGGPFGSSVPEKK